jgi:phosphoglycerate-specific signal transduction histidine kinase
MLPITLLLDSWPELWPKEWTRFIQQLWLVFFNHEPASTSSADLLESQFFLHAVQSPLSSLSINLELSLSALPIQHSLTRKYLYQALDNIKHLHALFHLLQNQTELKRRSFMAYPALQAVILRYHQPHRHHLVTSALQLADNTQIKGNIFYFQEALACLICNAFEAYPIRRNAKHVLVAAYTTHNRLVIYIGDVAEGMHWLPRQAAFLKGFTSKKQGSGLGLVFAKQVIEKQLKGELTLASFPQVGTIFVVTLPLKP